MYNIYLTEDADKETAVLFGAEYNITDDISQANIIVIGKRGISVEELSSKLIFAVADFSDGGLDSGIMDYCSDHGICVFRSCAEDSPATDPNSPEADPKLTADHIRDFIENGNISGSANFSDVDLGPFADDISRISVLMKGIDAPVLLGAMMTSEMDVRAVAGGLNGEYGTALIAAREPVMRLPHVDGVLKVRVLQDI